jgi:hypothetical protein
MRNSLKEFGAVGGGSVTIWKRVLEARGFTSQTGLGSSLVNGPDD